MHLIFPTHFGKRFNKHTSHQVSFDNFTRKCISEPIGKHCWNTIQIRDKFLHDNNNRDKNLILGRPRDLAARHDTVSNLIEVPYLAWI